MQPTTILTLGPCFAEYHLKNALIVFLRIKEVWSDGSGCQNAGDLLGCQLVLVQVLKIAIHHSDIDHDRTRRVATFVCTKDRIINLTSGIAELLGGSCVSHLDVLQNAPSKFPAQNPISSYTPWD